MTIDISEFTINVLYWWNPDLFPIAQKNALCFFNVTLRPFMKYHLLPCFPSRNIMKNTETEPPTMRDVIIAQPLKQISFHED